MRKISILFSFCLMLSCCSRDAGEASAERPSITPSEERFLTKIETKTGYPMFVDVRDGIVGKHLRETGVWEEAIGRALDRLVKPGDRILEIGANYGYHTIRMAKLAGNRGSVFSYEANEDVCGILDKNVNLNKVSATVRISCLAVSDSEKTVEFKTGFSNLGGSHVVGENKDQTTLHPNDVHFDDWVTRKIRAVSLDSDMPFKKIDVLRMDAEGSELAILKGAKSILSNSANLRIVMEWNNEMLSQFGDVDSFLNDLEGCGFNFYKIESDSGLSQKTRQEIKLLEPSEVVLSRKKLTANEMNGKLDLLNSYLVNNKIYVLMTTSPERIDKIVHSVISHLDLDLVEKVVVVLPERFQRTGKEYVIPDYFGLYPKLEVIRIREDFGPITKVLGAFWERNIVAGNKIAQEITSNEDNIVITMDDDVKCRSDFVRVLAEKVISHNSIVGGGGINVEYFGIKRDHWPDEKLPIDCAAAPIPHSRFPNKHRECDFVEGVWGIAYKVEYVLKTRDELRKLSTLKQCFTTDDLVLNYVFSRHKIPRISAENESFLRPVPLDYGFLPDALHMQGENGNRYQGCIKAIRDYRL